MKRISFRNIASLLSFTMLLMLFPVSVLASDLNDTQEYPASTITIANDSLTTQDTIVTRHYSDGLDYFSVQATGPSLALPENGAVRAKAVNDTEELASIQQLLEAKFEGQLHPVVYNLAIEDSGGEPIMMPADVQTTVTAQLATISGDPIILHYANGSLQKLAVTKSDIGSGLQANYTFTVEDLNGIILLNSMGVSEKEEPKRFNDYAAGEYRITANLYVKGTNNQVLQGVTAYLTNPDLPPVRPMEQNAIMTVDEYGEITIAIDVQNGIFSLQHIEGGTDVHIVNSIYGPHEGAEPGAFGPYSGRILQLVVTVDNLNGEYAFTNAKQYPTILQEDYYMPVHLGVDFNSAAKIINGEGESYTFTDQATQVSVVVQTQDSALIETLTEATLLVTELTEGVAYNHAQMTIAKQYVDEPGFKLYSLQLLGQDGSEIVFTQSEAIKVSLPVGADVTNGEVNMITDKAVKKIEATMADQLASIEGISTLGLFAVVDKGSIPTWINVTVADAETGMMLRAVSIDSDLHPQTGIFSERIKSFVGVMASKYTEGDRLDTALQGLQASKDYQLLNPQVTAAYQMAIIHNLLMMNGIEVIDAADPVQGASWQVWRGKNDGFFEAMIPVDNTDSRFYLITDNSEDIKATKLDAVVEGGMATITLMPRDLSAEEGKKRIHSLYWGERKVAPTTNRPISYVVEVKEQRVDKPVAITGLMHNGSALTGVAEGVGYTLTGHVATEAGTYTATATLETGYVWADGTTEPLLIQWTIAAGNSSGNNGNGPANPVVKTVTANLYVPGERNIQLPGVNAYLTNGNNPLGVGGYEKKAPTEPVANNAQLTTGPDGKRTLVLDIPNPVFTLQEIGGSTNAKIVSVKRDSNTYGKYTGRIIQITVELLDNSGTYVFWNSTEYPTILGVDWQVPLTLSVNFSGGSSGLPSDDNVDVGHIIDDTETSETDPKTGEVKETVTYENGTVYTKIMRSDGSSVHTMETIGGSVSVTCIDSSGKVTSEITLSEQDRADLKADTVIQLPMPKVTVTNKLDSAPSFKLTYPGDESVESLQVSIPADRVTPGTVVVKIMEDGTTQIVPDTRYNNGAINFSAEANVIYRLLDNSKSFQDVLSGQWYNDAIQYMAGREWMNGTDKSSFSPNATTNRGMIAAILYRMAGQPAIVDGSDPFMDVASNMYYADAVMWASTVGIVKGYSNGAFQPNAPVTREQLAVMLWRYAGSPVSSITLEKFSDQDQISGFAANAMAWAVEKGIIAGKGNGILEPKGKATRAQVAQMLMNFIENHSG